MNLHDLRTPQPLRDADFAAIRARVRAEIAGREERPWLATLLRFAFAASLLVLIVPYTRERAPEVPVERSLPAGRSAPSQTARVAARDAGEAAGRPALREEALPKEALREASLRKPARRKRPTSSVEHAAATRIEIITADPTIRIIWITPKENS